MVAVENVGCKAGQSQLQHIADALALLEHCRHAGHGLDVLLEVLDLLLGCAGQQLHDKAARAADAQILIDEHAQRADSGHLLTDSKIGRDVLGDLTGGQRHLADVRLAHTQVTDDIQYLPKELPQGKILGKVTLVDCIKMTHEFKEKLLKENSDIYTKSSFQENYGWQLEDVYVFDEPIDAKGHLSLWEYDLENEK